MEEGLLTTSARFTTDLAKLLVRTTDCRICSNCKEGEWGGSEAPSWLLLLVSPPSLGTYQLVVIDHN